MARAQQWQKEPNKYSWCFFCCICLEQCVYGQDVVIFMFLLFCLEVCIVINSKWGPHCCEYSKKTRVVFCILSTCHFRITFISTTSVFKLFYLRCQMNKIWKSRYFSGCYGASKQNCNCPIHDATIFDVRNTTDNPFSYILTFLSCFSPEASTLWAWSTS